MPAKKTSADDFLGVTIAGRYRIISRLGAGGMGTAYRAWDERAGVPVVIKIPKKIFIEDSRFAERFRREIRLLQGFTHPHIVPVVDVGEHEGLPFLAMRFLPGGSLSNRRLRDEQGKVRPNPSGMLHLWLPSVADALDFIHSQGVVHRDMKPANIFFDAGWGAFVGDFGIAKIVAESEAFEREQTLTATGLGIGTPEYMAPEQFAPKAAVDGRADQYSLAVIVYEMLAGLRPFTGESANLILEVMTQPAPRLNEKRAGLPPSLIAAVDRGLSKRPADRFATCREFAAAVLQDVQPLEDDPDLVRLLCPRCANLLKLPTSAAGKKGRCSKCQTEMKVAADLGAMWLLDEARRQEDAASVSGFELEGSAAGGDEQSPNASRSVSGKMLRGITATRHPRQVLAWIDRHGMILSGVLAIAALIPWLRPAGKPAAPQPGEKKSRIPAENQALDKRPAEASEHEKSLEQELAATRQAVARLEAEVAGLRAQPSSRRTDSSTVDPLHELTNSIGMKLRLIPPGTFLMGSEDGRPDEKPVHEVRITKPFYIGVYEVTSSQWKAVIGGRLAKSDMDNPPQGDVSWGAAVAFCKMLSESPHERAAGRVYRLPTEAEWEYACRAGTTTRFSFGNDDKALDWYGTFRKNNAGSRTSSVGESRPNAWGLYDMHGNVWEWCSDWYGRYSKDTAMDPQGPTEGFLKVLRGGSHVEPAVDCRSARRSTYDPAVDAITQFGGVGFRVASSASGPESGWTKPGEFGSDTRRPVATAGDTVPSAPGTADSDATASAPDILAQPLLRNSIGMELKLVPPGVFEMGSNDGRDNEKPVHVVRITEPFYLGLTEVTNAQWKAVMRQGTRSKEDAQPVEGVGWEDVVDFCERLSNLPAEKNAGRAYRLPTEAEWEYACRAGTATGYSFGNDAASLGDYAWYLNNSGRNVIDTDRILAGKQKNRATIIAENGSQAHPVGTKKPNPWGLYDMHGNVWEWCSDWHGAYHGAGISDPNGPATGDRRVARGGGCKARASDCRSACRGSVFGEVFPSDDDTGFRIALSLSGTIAPRREAAVQAGAGQQSDGTTAAASAAQNLDDIAANPAEEILALPPLRNSIGMELKLIPAGVFKMGSKDGSGNEKPIHEVRITKPFYLGVSEVTNGQWKKVMDNVRSLWKEADRPVEHVSWDDAVEFCEQLSSLPAEKALGRVYRLPTEAEWEYACRAGTTTQFSFGDAGGNLSDFGFFHPYAGAKTHPVRQKKPNPWGLYDMHGNVWEWCSDWYGPYGAEMASDPTGPLKGTHRAYRGGGWNGTARYCRSAGRSSDKPGDRDFAVGFRLALSPPEATSQ